MKPSRPLPTTPAGLCVGQQVDTGVRPASPSSTPRTLDSAQLFQGQPLLLIHHLGEIYRLQTTRQGKLILTK